jgi:putative flippase GtrA
MTLRKQSFRFVVTGAAAGATDLLVNALLTEVFHFDPLTANPISRPLGGLVSFTLNKYWTFENRGRASAPHQFLRYALVWVVSFTASQLMVAFYSRWVGLAAFPTKLAAEATVGIFSFLCQKFWTFR